jgi:hypothetical protein
MMAQDVAATAAVVWRLVQSFVSAQPFRKTASTIQINNPRLFMEVTSFNSCQYYPSDAISPQEMI